MSAYHILADIVLAIHVAFAGFVVIGFAAIVGGVLMRWRFIANLWFRIAHLVAIALVAAESILGADCPLTSIEDSLRVRAGESWYGGGFIDFWMHRLMFYDVPHWMFTIGYVAFAALVLAVFVMAPPKMPAAPPS